MYSLVPVGEKNTRTRFHDPNSSKFCNFSTQLILYYPNLYFPEKARSRSTPHISISVKRQGSKIKERTNGNGVWNQRYKYTFLWKTYFTNLPVFLLWQIDQTSPTVVSLKGRLPQKLWFKSTLSCEIVQIHSLFRQGFIKKPKSKFNPMRK